MSKRVTLIDDITGRVVTGTVSRKATKAKLIPLTPAPKTRWQKFKRDAWG